jgi:hypothetical protein
VLVKVVDDAPSEYRNVGGIKQILINAGDPRRAWSEEAVHAIQDGDPVWKYIIDAKENEVLDAAVGLPNDSGRTAVEIIGKEHLVNDSGRWGLSSYDKWYLKQQLDRLRQFGVTGGY